MENLRRQYDQLKKPTATLLASDFEEFSRHFQGFVRMPTTDPEPLEYTDPADKFMKSILRNPGLSPGEYLRLSALEPPRSTPETDPACALVQDSISNSKRRRRAFSWFRTILVVLLVFTMAYSVKQLIY